MKELASWISTNWNAVWGLVIYFYRMIHGLFFGTGQNDREDKIEKLKGIGQDLYWISVIFWGVILLNLNSQYLDSLLGKGIHIRFLILFGIALLGPIINRLREKGQDFIGKAPKTRLQVVKLGLMYLGIHIVGFGSLLIALMLIGR
jgi:hypothetical protein